jgi:predicted GNAT family acetyltransferase
VPPSARGEGVGDALVRAAVAHARSAGLQLIPTCPFVEAWLRRHPQERDVFAEL